MDRFRTNNFDLIRLAAALQVVLYHCHEMKVVALPQPLVSILLWVPGVPIFFFVSGFLISRSFESNRGLRDYARNRLVRIYPGLWLCFAASLASVALAGHFQTVEVSPSRFALWVGAQLSVGQVYNPPFLRTYGVGGLNPSLWTIAVELQLYALVPLLYRALRGASKQAFDRALVVLVLVFVGVNQAYVWEQPFKPGRIGRTLVMSSFLPWFYMFLMGVLAQRSFDRLHALLARPGRLLACLLAYPLVCWLTQLAGWPGVGNRLNPLAFSSLALCVFGLAYCAPGLADRLLRRNDVSYGVYIFHMPVMNVAVVLGLAGSLGGLAFVLGVTLVAALVSWFVVERPCLRLKRRAFAPR